jgi:hypothetical protein
MDVDDARAFPPNYYLYKRMIELDEKIIQARSKRAEAEYTAQHTLEEPCTVPVDPTIWKTKYYNCVLFLGREGVPPDNEPMIRTCKSEANGSKPMLRHQERWRKGSIRRIPLPRQGF